MLCSLCRRWVNVTLEIVVTTAPDEARNWRKAHHLEWQIPADRYYAVWVLGSLKDPQRFQFLFLY